MFRLPRGIVNENMEVAPGHRLNSGKQRLACATDVQGPAFTQLAASDKSAVPVRRPGFCFSSIYVKQRRMEQTTRIAEAVGNSRKSGSNN